MDMKRLVVGVCLVLGVSVTFCQVNREKQTGQLKSTDQKTEFGQEALSEEDYADFNLILHQDLESTPVGPYETAQWEIDWNYPPNAQGVYTGDRTIILDSNKGGRKTRCMEWNFPEGTFSTSKEHGFNWRPRFDPVEEVYISFSIMFKPGFEAVKGGKIPGVSGGPKVSGRPEWDNGFGGSLMFKPGSKGVKPVFYTYHHDMPEGLTVGETVRWGDYEFDVSTDVWYDVTYRIVMNTATATNSNGPDGLKDGILEGYVNGKLFGQRTGLRLRNLADIGIDVLRVQGFFGGSTDSWETIRDEWMLIDNMYVWTYSDEYLDNHPEAKRGRQPNTLGDVIYTPMDVLFGNEIDDGSDPDNEDKEAPTVPSNLVAVDSTRYAISLNWEPASDNVEVSGYRIYLNDKIVGATGLTSYTINSLDPSTKYFVAVSAFDARLNESPKSTALVVYTKAKDIEAPSVPAFLRVDRISSNTIEASWEASTDNYGVDRYEVILDGVPSFSTAKTAISISDLQPNTSYRISVRAYDTSGNVSPTTTEVTVNTREPDSEPPSTPTNLSETGVTQTTTGLAWEASTDNRGVRKYTIYVNDTEWESASLTEKTIGGLQPGIEYAIEVSAIDLDGNESAKSSSIQVTTLNSDLTTQPVLPQVSIIQVQDNTSSPRTLTEMSYLGFAELKNFGLKITEPASLGKEPLILKEARSTQVVNSNRVTEGLKALYNFSEGEGSKVRDISDIEPRMDLHISKEGLATEWLVGQGLRISENTIIAYQGSTEELIDDLSVTNEITFEVWLKQEEIEQSGPARIMTLSTDNSYPAFTLGHLSDALHYNYISWLNTSADGNSMSSDLETDQDFEAASLHHIVYTRNKEGIEQIYINGLELARGIREGDFSTWSRDYQFALANEATGESPWKGVYYLAALYDRSLSSKEVNQNYNAGLGQVRFETDLDVLEANVGYKLTPFVKTDQGLIYGQAKDFHVNSLSDPDEFLSFYPNPSDGNVSVTIINEEIDVPEAYLRVADFSGQVHFSEKIDLSEGLLEKKIHLQLPESLVDGLYSLILIKGSTSVAKKLILMR